jgi:hypothetical protein
MTTLDFEARLLALLADTPDLYERLRQEGLIPEEAAAMSNEHVETARVVRTLVHELEVNWAGVEVILRMRTELIDTRRQIAELARLLRDRQPGV